MRSMARAWLGAGVLACAPAMAWAQPAAPPAVLPPELPWSGRSAALARPAEDAWATPAEASGFTRTPRYEETVAWLRRLAAATPLVQLTSIGTSPEGRDLVMAVVSSDRAFTPEAARATGKTIVLAHGGIHAGEIDGKDAGLMLLRDMTVGGTARDLLDGAILLFLPIFNVDGHERFSAYTRINQRGPAEAGWRANATNRNLNRDYAKADTAEMRAMLRAIGAWDPQLYVDMHVTNGADYRPDITWGYNGPDHHSPSVGRWLHDVATPAIARDLVAMGHQPGTLLQLVDTSDPDKGIRGWWAEPRFSNGYGDFRHLPTLLLENHSLKPYRQRVLGTRVFLESVMRLAAREAASLRRAIAEGRASRRDPVVLDFVPDRASKETIEFEAVDWRHRTSPVTGGPVVEWLGTSRTRRLPFVPMMTPGTRVSRPSAYLVPAARTEVVERLEAHGVRLERLTAPLTADVEMYRIVGPKLAPAPYEGRARVDTFTVEVEKRRQTFPAGTVRVATDQPLGDVAILLLEPQGIDSLFRWGFFLDILQQTEYAEAYIMAPTAERMLRDDPALAKAFEQAIAADPALAASPSARIQWFYARTPYLDDRLRLYPVARVP